MAHEHKPQTEWNDHKVEVVIGRLLQIGVLLAATVVLIGGAWYLITKSGQPVTYHKFHEEIAGLRSITGVINGIKHGSSEAVMQAGILLLIATPIARVAFSIGAFAREKDMLYVVITLIVLSVLLYSLLGSGSS